MHPAADVGDTQYKKGGESRRMVHLRFRNDVDGVDYEAD